MKVKEWSMRKRWTPTTIGSNETTALFNVAAGQRVVSSSWRIITNAAASTSSTATLGDGVDPDGFITAIDTEVGTAGQENGAYHSSRVGKLYLVADTVDVDYVAGTAGATKPVIEFAIRVAQEWP